MLFAVLAVGAGLFLVQPAAFGQADYFKAPSATATSTAAAATINGESGIITTEALTTAAQASYSFTLTDSMITTKSVLLINVAKGTATTGGLVPAFIAPAAGSAVIIFQNPGSAAVNGTVKISFIVIAK